MYNLIDYTYIYFSIEIDTLSIVPLDIILINDRDKIYKRNTLN